MQVNNPSGGGISGETNKERMEYGRVTGSTSSNGQESVSISFATAFSTSPYVSAKPFKTDINGNSGRIYIWSAYSGDATPSTTSFTMALNSPSNAVVDYGADWQAIGE